VDSLTPRPYFSASWLWFCVPKARSRTRAVRMGPRIGGTGGSADSNGISVKSYGLVRLYTRTGLICHGPSPGVADPAATAFGPDLIAAWKQHFTVVQWDHRGAPGGLWMVSPGRTMTSPPYRDHIDFREGERLGSRCGWSQGDNCCSWRGDAVPISASDRPRAVTLLRPQKATGVAFHRDSSGGNS
jgi:hypothetical protein